MTLDDFRNGLLIDDDDRDREDLRRTMRPSFESTRMVRLSLKHFMPALKLSVCFAEVSPLWSSLLAYTVPSLFLCPAIKKQTTPCPLFAVLSGWN